MLRRKPATPSKDAAPSRARALMGRKPTKHTASRGLLAVNCVIAKRAGARPHIFQKGMKIPPRHLGTADEQHEALRGGRKPLSAQLTHPR
jgi:hypothetical protein